MIETSNIAINFIRCYSYVILLYKNLLRKCSSRSGPSGPFLLLLLVHSAHNLREGRRTNFLSLSIHSPTDLLPYRSVVQHSYITMVVSAKQSALTTPNEEDLRVPCYCEENVWRLAVKRKSSMNHASTTSSDNACDMITKDDCSGNI